MPTHDPSTCPRCRWAAEWFGIRPETEIYQIPGGKVTAGEAPLSFCTSLDAVAGLWAELVEATDNPEWWTLERRKAGWGFYKLRCLGSECEFMHEVTTAEYLAPANLPAACVIDAAMVVLRGKESDASL